MITAETQPRGRGHRDDGHEEEIQQADNDTKRKKVTNKHHQRGESSQQGHAVLDRSEVERLEAHGVREEFTAWCKTQIERPDSCRGNGKCLKGEFCPTRSCQRVSPDQDP